MKRKFLATAAVLAVISLVGCADSSPQAVVPTAEPTATSAPTPEPTTTSTPTSEPKTTSIPTQETDIVSTDIQYLAYYIEDGAVTISGIKPGVSK